jgi:hypothetical protein
MLQQKHRVVFAAQEYKLLEGKFREEASWLVPCHFPSEPGESPEGS